jgi:histidinol phosphatase-like PHP family hydrolase
LPPSGTGEFILPKQECLMTDFHIQIAETPSANTMDAASAIHYASLAGLRCAGLILPSDGSRFAMLERLSKQVRRLSLYANLEAWLGVELRHIPPALLPTAVREARDAGAQLVLVHGETLADQAEPGTNFAAVDAGADILAHPGLLDKEVAVFAAEKGVALEFTSCPRHGLTNAHTAAMAQKHGCLLVCGSAARCPEELTSRTRWESIILGADTAAVCQDRPALSSLIHSGEQHLIRRLMQTCHY